MVLRLLRILFLPIFHFRLDRLGAFMARIIFRILGKTLGARLTDDLFELVLRLVDICFHLSDDFRKNIENFQASYVFNTKTAKGIIEAAVIFGNENMVVKEHAIPCPNVTVTFDDADALRRFLFSRELDALDLVLENKIEIDGNWNYVHRFLFIVKDLLYRLGVNTLKR